MNATDEWQLHVLGTFRLEQGKREIRLVRRKAASLLVYLILYPEKHGRTDLATLFWGDFPDSEALASLRTALSALRSTVDNDIIIAESESVRFNPTFPLWVDALAFQSYAARFLAEAPFDFSTSFIDLYKGDLLPDFYDDWISPERERLRTLYLDSLLHITQQMRSRSEYERAIEFARRVLAIEPSNERAHQHIMFCYVTLGDRSAALKQYEACRQALQDDLGVEPMAETTALYHWIKGRPAHERPKETLITNLPIPLTSFVGREQQTAEVKRLLSQARLLTLAGPGGSGKTRLAIQVATDLVDAYKDGVWFTDLATLDDPAQVVAALVRTLRVAAPGIAPTVDTLIAFLRGRHTLLVLDNCEHLVAACARLAQELLSAAPQVKILATSREILDVQGEVVYQVPALSTPAVAAIPPSLATLAGFEATHLFIERATAFYPELSLSDRDSSAVIAVCRQLDGMPLAIELAAARVRILSVEQIADHLRERFALLASSGHARPSRQASLRAAIDWSYDLLPGDEQSLLRRLSVFAGGFSLAGASAVDKESGTPTLERLARLVDKSLLVVIPSSEEQRYRLLETIKLYAWEKLVAAGERDEVVHCYISFVSGIVEDAGERYARDDAQPALRQARTMYDDIIAALAWCEELADITTGLHICLHSELLLLLGGLPALSRHLSALLAADTPVSPAVRGAALASAGNVAIRLGHTQQAWRLGEEGLALCQSGGDSAAIAHAKLWLGRLATFMGKWDIAGPLLEQSLALYHEIGYHNNALVAQLFLADVCDHAGDQEQARTLNEDGLRESRKTKYVWGEQYAIRSISWMAHETGDYATAAALCKESLVLCIDNGLRGEIGFVFISMAACAAAQGQFERAMILRGAFQTAHVWTSEGGVFRRAGNLEAAVAAARPMLGDAASDALVARGQAMTLEQATAYALSEA